MQLTMGRSADGHQVINPARPAPSKPEPYPYRHKQHRSAKSQPFDAEDLRRRLYVVIAEQEASKKQRRVKVHNVESPRTVEKETSTSRPTSTKLEHNQISFAARMIRTKDMATDTLLKESPPQPSEPKPTRSMSRSIQDKLKRKSSKIEPVTIESITNSPSYHHVPQEAATQFVRTATATGMHDRILVHSLSQSALKYHVEGRLSDRIELDASTTPAQQKRVLERVHSQSEKTHSRNQFQSPKPVADELEEPRQYRRHSVIGLTPAKSKRKNSFGNILEEEVMAIRPAPPIDPPIEEISSEETLVADPALAHEHRVDWTQHDEKPRVGVKIPLLRKADSLWTLKGKLTPRRGSAPGIVRDERMDVLREKHESGSSPTSPSQSKFLRFGFLARFKR
ncbi:hypothetical protein M426DRAFT_321738 [Hypoxylon sp. CI-4A]|nr:hypothetical protein M426DRAFT_321738 [Hypoxylon sp. CI-4A]